MNAPVTITDGQLLAAAILNGNMPKADWPIYTPAEWLDEARNAIAENDYDTLLAMVDEQDEADREEEALRRAEYSGTAPSRRSWLGGLLA